MKWILAALVFCAAGAVKAQPYPAKPVRIIVTFTVGGAADLTARLAGDKLAELWKQPIVVENRIGAGGRIGAEAVQKSAPDGYTLLLLANTHAINQALYKDQAYDLLKDFAPLGLTTSTPMVLAVNPRMNVKTMREFTDLLRSSPARSTTRPAGSRPRTTSRWSSTSTPRRRTPCTFRTAAAHPRSATQSAGRSMSSSRHSRP